MPDDQLAPVDAQLPAYLQPGVYDDKDVDRSDVLQFVAPPTIKLVRAQTLDESARNLLSGQPYIMEGVAVPVVDMLPGPNPQKPSEECVPFNVIPIITWKSWAGFISNSLKIKSYSNDPNSPEARKAEQFFGKELNEQDDEGQPIKVTYRESYNWLFYVPHLQKVCKIVFGSTAKPAAKKLSQLIAARKPTVAPPACMFTLFTKMHPNTQGAPFPQWEVGMPKEGGWNTDTALYTTLMEQRKVFQDQIKSGLLQAESETEATTAPPSTASSM